MAKERFREAVLTSSSPHRDFVLACLAALTCTCGRGPVPAREAAPSASPVAATPDAGPHDANTPSLDLADAPMTAVTDASLVSPQDQAALGDALSGLYDERRSRPMESMLRA